jgi:hypothetical protein
MLTRSVIVATVVTMHLPYVFRELSQITATAVLRGTGFTKSRVLIQDDLATCANSMQHHATSSTAALETLPVTMFVNKTKNGEGLAIQAYVKIIAINSRRSGNQDRTSNNKH